MPYSDKSRELAGSACVAQAFDGQFIQFKHNICVGCDEGQERFARALAPVIAAIEGIFALLALSQAVEAPNHVICVSVMQRGTMRHHVLVPLL